MELILRGTWIAHSTQRVCVDTVRIFIIIMILNECIIYL